MRVRLPWRASYHAVRPSAASSFQGLPRLADLSGCASGREATLMRHALANTCRNSLEEASARARAFAALMVFTFRWTTEIIGAGWGLVAFRPLFVAKKA